MFNFSDINFPEVMVGLLLSLLIGELMDWFPKISEVLVKFAARLVDQDDHRFEADWLDALHETPGKYFKLAFAIQILLFALQRQMGSLMFAKSRLDLPFPRIFSALAETWLETVVKVLPRRSAVREEEWLGQMSELKTAWRKIRYAISITRGIWLMYWEQKHTSPVVSEAETQRNDAPALYTRYRIQLHTRQKVIARRYKYPDHVTLRTASYNFRHHNRVLYVKVPLGIKVEVVEPDGVRHVPEHDVEVHQDD